MMAGRRYAAFLFDMDGTLIDSIPSAVRIWTRWAERHGVDVPSLLHAMHGVRAIETIRRFAPHADHEAEAAQLTQDEIDDVDGVLPIPGAAEFLASLPADRWAIVTSAPRDLALVRLAAAGLAPPAVLVTADDVSHGKPAPDCYLAAAALLGVNAADCLVWEDAPAGIAAGEAAGADVAIITATHASSIDTPHRTFADYRSIVAVSNLDSGLTIVAR